MATIGSLVVHLGVDSRKFSNGLNSARGAIGGFTSFAIGAATTIGTALAAAFELKAAVSAQQEAIKSTKKLESVVKSTGKSAGFTAKQLSEFASQLQDVTNFEDDATKSALAVLSTFTKIRGQAFKQATIAAMNMSSVLDQDLKSSIIQVGKALNDPVKGITALSRAGVSFTAQQKEMIKTLAETGNLLGAQTLILQELETEFGGAAMNMADPLLQLKNAWGDIQEMLGAIVLPAMRDIVNILKVLTKGITENGEAVEKAGNDLRQLIPAMGDVIFAAGLLADAWQMQMRFLKGVQAMLTSVISASGRALQLATLPQRMAGRFKAELEMLDAIVEAEEKLFNKQFDEFVEMGNKPWAHQGVDAFFDRVHEQAQKAKKELDGLSRLGSVGALGPNPLPIDLKNFGPAPTLPKLPPGLQIEKGALDRFDKLTKIADKVRDSVRTPIEQFELEFKKLKGLFAEGFIDGETLQRAIKDAMRGIDQKDLHRFFAQQGLTDLQIPGGMFQAAGAFNLRTAEGQRGAFSALVGAKFSGGNDQKQIAANTKKMVEHLKTIAEKAKQEGEKIEITEVHF